MSKQHKTQQQIKIDNQAHKEGCKLPYLNSHVEIPYQAKPKNKKHHSLHRDFDLNTNYVSIPRYSALEDKNLAYFFDKVKNKKLLEELRAQELRKNRKNQAKTDRQSKNNKNKQVSQIDFMEYILKMKKKVTNVPKNI